MCNRCINNRHELKAIEVCGGIAAGKTTFTALFSNSNLVSLFENFKESPFWKAFYTNPGKYIFETEISFILLHYHQIKKHLEEKHKKIICDFSFILDLAYAKIGLSGSQLDTFKCVLDEIRKELPEPELYIYLDCDAETQLLRIKNRQRPEENLITVDFLASLNSALNLEVAKIDPSKVITINSAEKDFANNDSVKREMRALIEGFLQNENPNS